MFLRGGGIDDVQVQFKMQACCLRDFQVYNTCRWDRDSLPKERAPVKGVLDLRNELLQGRTSGDEALVHHPVKGNVGGVPPIDVDLQVQGTHDVVVEQG